MAVAGDPRPLAAEAKKGDLSWRALGAFTAVGLLGLVIFLLWRNQAFPTVAMDVRVSRAELLERSRAFLESRGADLTDYRNVLVFAVEQPEVDFVERHLGVAKAVPLLRGLMTPWRWKARWFAEGETTEYTVAYTPDGRLAAYDRRIPERDSGPELTEDEARPIAEAFVREQARLNLDDYEFIEHKTTDRPNRKDNEFAWRRKSLNLAGAEYRVWATVQGDQVGQFGQWLRRPQDWERAEKDLKAKRDLLGGLDGLAMILLFAAALGLLLWRASRRDVRWRPSLIGAGVLGVVGVAGALNELPSWLIEYETTVKYAVFWFERVAIAVGAGAALFALGLMEFGVAESIGRWGLPDRPAASGLFSGAWLARAEHAPQRILCGYAVALAMLGYVTAFYVLGARWLGVWTPVETSLADDFSSCFPALRGLHVGLMATLTEELGFRLFPIALLLRLTGRRWLALLVPALIWSFGHTAYPQEPIWIRGVELAVVGVAFGAIFLRYGLLVTLSGHYVYDCALSVEPLLRSARFDLQAQAIAVTLLPAAVALALALVSRRIHIAVPAPPAEIPEAERIPEATEEPAPEEAPPLGPSPVWETLPARRFWGFVALSVAMLIGGLLLPEVEFFADRPPAKLTHDKAAQQNAAALRALGFDPTGYFTVTEFELRKSKPPDYLIRELGPAGAQRAFGAYYKLTPTWRTKWFRDHSVRSYEIQRSEDGRLSSFRETTPEDEPGARLTEEDATDLARRFLGAQGYDLKRWRFLDAKQRAFAGRLDYEIRFRDERFAFHDMRRLVKVTVAGDHVGGLGGVSFKVPEDERRRVESEEKSARNAVREVLRPFAVAGMFVAALVQLVLLMRRRASRLGDLKAALGAAAAAVVLWQVGGWVNDLPGLYDNYIKHTERSMSQYALQSGLHVAIAVVGLLLAVGALLFFVLTALRAWAPAVGDWRRLLAPLHPRQWGTAASLQGAAMGLAVLALGEGWDRVHSWAMLSMAPFDFSPAAAAPNVEFNQLNEWLALICQAPFSLTRLVTYVAAALVARRYAKREWVYVLAAVALAGMFTDDQSPSWEHFAYRWVLAFAMLLGAYLLVARVLRWNVTAYAVALFAFVPPPAGLGWLLKQSNWEFRGVGVARLVVMLGPALLVLAVGLWQRRRARARTAL